MIGGDRLTQNTMDSESKKNPGAGWVGGLVKRDFRSHSGSSEHSLDSESKFEPSVAKFMRQLLNTNSGCPIVQLYLELGHTPARFGIMKLRLYFLKTILDQEKRSLISKIFHLQCQNGVKTDWATTCLNNLKELNINLTEK